MGYFCWSNRWTFGSEPKNIGCLVQSTSFVLNTLGIILASLAVWVSFTTESSVTKPFLRDNIFISISF